MGVRYKYGRNLRVDTKHVLKISNPIEYNLPMFDVNTEYVIARDGIYFVYNNDYHKYVIKDGKFIRNFDNNIWKDTESILLLNNNGQI